MRRISLPQIAVFVALFALAAALAALAATRAAAALPEGMWRAPAVAACFIATLYLVALIAFRMLVALRPLPIGDIAEGSRDEATYHVYLLFFLILFYPVMRAGFVPVPLMRLFYLALGARLGDNTYSAGLLLDPPLLSLGRDCLVGQQAMLVPHVIEGRRLAHYPITVGDRVTIGAGAIVLAGCTIGDDAIVSSGAVVTKGTRIGAGEVWGGVPARRLRGPDR
jgi:acetyltransferase-like isoleucine patch superfamily enzyme